LGGTMLGIALGGLAVNVVVFLILRTGDEHNLNIRAAALHVMGDLLGSVAAVIASVVILTTGWMPIDPLLSMVVALIILRSAWRIVADSGHILLEGSPPGFDARAVKDDIRAALPYVLDVHHVHAWSISQERPMVTLHANVSPDTSSTAAVRDIKRMLAEHFRITHATVEIEYGACVDDPSAHSAC
jgi:cobalt-zinc-cadmium efflux system protein